jgi:hypothetical protein
VGVTQFNCLPRTSLAWLAIGNNRFMRTPGHRRPPRGRFTAPPPGVSLVDLAVRATYVGSPEHKTYPSFAGPPAPRADATKCDPSFTDAAVLTGWLREAIRDGQVGGVWEEGTFPRYVWCRREGEAYQARVVNAEQGTYKGWRIASEEEPEGLP